MASISGSSSESESRKRSSSGEQDARDYLVDFYYCGMSFTKVSLRITQEPKPGMLGVTKEMCSEGKEWTKFRAVIKKDYETMDSAGLCKFNFELNILLFLFVTRQAGIYCHETHVSFSNVKSLHIQMLASVMMEDRALPDPCKTEHHHVLLPFFHDNIALCNHVYPQYLKTSSAEVQPEIQREIDTIFRILSENDSELDQSPYYTSSDANLHGTLFMEDVWSKRLVNALKTFMPTYETRFTGNDKNFVTFQYRYTKHSNAARCFFFRGAPDIMMKKKPIAVGSGGSDGTDRSSDDEVTIESSRQALTMNESANPTKLGELFAQLHFMIVAKLIRKLSKNRTPATINSRGLLIEKQTGGIRVRATVDFSARKSLKFVQESYPASILDEGRLCIIINDLLGKPRPTQSLELPESAEAQV